MGTIQIEKDVPIPADDSRRVSKYPFRDMEVGDSFFVACENGNPAKAAIAVRSSAIIWGKRKGHRKFTTRIVEGGVRVWRIQ